MRRWALIYAQTGQRRWRSNIEEPVRRGMQSEYCCVCRDQSQLDRESVIQVINWSVLKDEVFVESQKNNQKYI